MRQTLNILQSVAMAHGAVTEDAAYACTGNPSPQVMETIAESLFNDDMSTAFGKLHRLQARAPLLAFVHTHIKQPRAPARSFAWLTVMNMSAVSQRQARCHHDSPAFSMCTSSPFYQPLAPSTHTLLAPSDHTV
jgi:hypothetical protein